MEPIFYSDCGIRVDRVTLTGTAMATYVEIEYTVIDASMFTTPICFKNC